MPAKSSILKLFGITDSSDAEDDGIEVVFDFSNQFAFKKTFGITKQQDEFSSLLFQKLADQSLILFGSVTSTDDTGETVHSFSNLQVSSFAVSGAGPAGDPAVTENVGFRFQKVQISFTS